MALIKDVDSILKDRKIKVRKLGEKFEHTRLMPDDEWYPKAVRSKIRPARWNWKDCHAKLKEIVGRAFEETWDVHQRRDISMRLAAYGLAVERVAEATMTRGLYP